MLPLMQLFALASFLPSPIWATAARGDRLVPRWFLNFRHGENNRRAALYCLFKVYLATKIYGSGTWWVGFSRRSNSSNSLLWRRCNSSNSLPWGGTSDKPLDTSTSLGPGAFFGLDCSGHGFCATAYPPCGGWPPAGWPMGGLPRGGLPRGGLPSLRECDWPPPKSP